MLIDYHHGHRTNTHAGMRRLHFISVKCVTISLTHLSQLWFKSHTCHTSRTCSTLESYTVWTSVSKVTQIDVCKKSTKYLSKKIKNFQTKKSSFFWEVQLSRQPLAALSSIYHLHPRPLILKALSYAAFSCSTLHHCLRSNYNDIASVLLRDTVGSSLLW